MWQEALGFIGVLQILLAYFAVQTGVISSQQIRFSVLNFIGASLVLTSLIGSENYAAMLLEVAWILISAFGIYKAVNNHRLRALANQSKALILPIKT